MILNNETALKVSSLFKTPHNKVEYSGVYYTGTTSFTLTQEDENLTVSGFHVHITPDFKVYKVERLKQVWGMYKGQTVNEYLPIHPAGNKTLLYKIMKEEKELKKHINN